VSGRVVETERLLVRPIEPDDVEALAALWCDPQATAYMGGPRPLDEVTRALREDLPPAEPPRFNLWPTIEKASGRIVGHCGLLEKEVAGRAAIELVYVLAPWAWGRGYATEAGRAIRDHAVTGLRCGRLMALIHPGNAASERVAAKLGFRCEGDVERPHGSLRLYAFAPPESAIPQNNPMHQKIAVENQ
jgi:ribosomal-protein-alanine N-acetyltransferase